jgi:hypothetical protein
MAVRSLQSDLAPENRENGPEFSNLQQRVRGEFRCRFRLSGGEGGILLPPFLAGAYESYTSGIIPCVLAGCKLFSTFASVSTVSPICCDSDQNGITGISGNSR